MRIPVFARRSNPAVDRPILRKSLKYVTEQIESGRANWVDPSDPAKGIVCREMLYFGEREIPVETVSCGTLPVELPGIKFVPPLSYRQTHPSPAGIRENWDWNLEPLPTEPLHA